MLHSRLIFAIIFATPAENIYLKIDIFLLTSLDRIPSPILKAKSDLKFYVLEQKKALNLITS
jgi:hypothetical protein